MKAIRIIIAGVDQFTAAFSKSMKGIEAIGKKVEKVGKTISVGVSLPILAALAVVTSSAAKYEASMSRVGAITGATSQQMAMMNSVAEKMGRTTQFSSVSAAEGFRLMADSGFSVQDSIAGLPSVLELSTMGLVSLAEAVDIADNLTEGYNRNISEMSKINDVMAMTAKRGGIGVKTITDGLLNLSPISQQLGISLEEMSATLGVLGQTGTNMTRGIKGLQTGLAALVNPGTEAIKVFQRLKIKKADIFESNGQLKGMSELLNTLSKSGATATDLMEIFGVQAGPIMGKLLGKGADALKDFQAGLEGSKGTAAGIVAAQEQTFTGQLNKLKASGITLAKSFGDALLPILTPLVGFLTKLSNVFMNLSPGTKRFIVIIGGLIAALGPLLVMIGGVMTFLAPVLSSIAAAGGLIALISNPITLGIAAVMAFVGVITYMSTHLKSKLTGVIAAFFPLAGVVTWIITRWERLLPFFKLLFLALGVLFKGFAGVVSFIFSPIINIVSFLGNLIFKTLDLALGFLEKLSAIALPDWLQKKIGLITEVNAPGGVASTPAGIIQNMSNINKNENKTTIVIDNKAGAKIKTTTDKGDVDLQTYTGALLPLGG